MYLLVIVSCLCVKVANAKVHCGAVGDGFADDGKALQRCLETHTIVVVPKGFFRLGKTLVLSRPNSALVGVGRSTTVLMPTHNNFEGDVLIRVTAPNITVHQLSYVTFW